MISLGPTSDIVVAGLLAISQLITPVPESAIKKVEAELQTRHTCQDFKTASDDYAQKKCETLKEDRRKYKEECQDIENKRDKSEVQCATEPSLLTDLHFKPRSIAEYMTMSNAQLVEELHTICDVVQDRIFLEPEQWSSGVTADRNDLSSKIVILKNPELQKTFSAILQEAADGTFDTVTASKVVTALCHWKIDRKAVAEQVDFTGAYKYLGELTSELPRVDRLPELPQASFVFDNQNQRIGEIYDTQYVTRNGERYLGQVGRRRSVRPDQMPTQLMNAFISIEDKRFRQHNGFDFEAVRRLIYSGTSGSAQGGSTFTMQLLKNAFFGSDVEQERSLGKRTLRRKIKEILMIPLVEAAYSKDQILTYYLNLISLTANAQGVLMTALDLFNKDDLHALTLPEMALLAAMPKGTTIYNPRRFPKAATARRNLVLDAMADQGYISSNDRDAAKSEALKLADSANLDQGRIYSRYFVGDLDSTFRKLRRKNLRDDRWKTGGFDIKTGFSLELQRIVTNSVQKGLLNFEKNVTNRFKWKPWLDSATNQNFNVAKRVAQAAAKPDDSATTNQDTALDPHNPLDEIFEFLNQAHPYPDTSWVVALKTPKNPQWQLADGKTAAVVGGDQSVFRNLKDYDAVVLEPLEDGTFRLASPTEVQGAAVVMDVESGEVLATTGGFTSGPYGKFAQNSRVTRSMLMPGSTIKPITYLYALNHGVQPSTVVRDGGVRFPKIDGCPFIWHPSNYKSRGGGQVTVQTALENSMNLPLVNTFLKTTGLPPSLLASGDLSAIEGEQKNQLVNAFNSVYDLATAFGAYPDRREISSTTAQPLCFPWLLGGIETTPMNMVRTYAEIANGGLKRQPIFLRQVFKDETPLIVDNTQTLRDQVHEYRAAVIHGYNVEPAAFDAIPGVTPQSIYQLHWLMQGVLRRGTARAMADWAELIAGKTGTTNNSKNVWFSGYNSKIAVVVWIGYDNAQTYSDLGNATGGAVAVPIFKSILEGYYKMHPEELNNPLPTPADIPGLVKTKMNLSTGSVYPDASAPAGTIDEFMLESAIPVAQPKPKPVTKLKKI